MAAPVYIGDEVSASGYRLAGLRVHTPGQDELSAIINSECANAPLILISADMARRLPAAQLDSLLARVTPPVVLVPDVRGNTPLADLAIRLRQQLGVLE